MTSRLARQPWLGLTGLLFVVPIGALLAVAGGPETAVRVLGPLVAIALTPVAMVAFWWNRWPGTTLRPAWSGWVDTVVIAVLALALALVGQVVVGRADLRGLVDPTPGVGHTPTYPVLLPIGAAAFTAMLQLTQVIEGWPLRRLPPVPGGVVATAIAYLVAVALYLLFVDVHPPKGVAIRPRDGVLTGAEFGAILTMIGAWQIWLYLAWHGWPFTMIRQAGIRRALATVVIVAGGLLTYAGLRRWAEPDTLVAVGGAAIAAGLVASVLFAGTLRPLMSASTDRVVSLLVIGALTVLLHAAISSVADTRTWPGLVTSEAWQAQAASALSLSVVLHVAVGRRWPLGH